jgi:hypothetical protein
MKSSLSGSAMMLLSAAIFAYFGFASSWAHQYTTTQPPQLLSMVVVLKWTLRGGAIGFASSAIIAMVRPAAGELVYALISIVTAISFVIVAIWEWTNPQGYHSGVPAVLLVIFAAWNGFGAMSGLMSLRQAEANRSVGSPSVP